MAGPVLSTGLIAATAAIKKASGLGWLNRLSGKELNSLQLIVNQYQAALVTK